MNKKLGPLPVWAWGILGGIAVYFLYVRTRGQQGGAGTGPTAGVLDPNAVDPTTGLTYGQELGGNGPVDGGLGGGGSGGDLGGMFGNFDSELMAFLQAQQDFGLLAGGLGYKPPHTSDGTERALNNLLKWLKAHPPTTKPSVHHKKPKHHKKPHPKPKHPKHPGQHHSPQPTPGHKGDGVPGHHKNWYRVPPGVHIPGLPHPPHPGHPPQHRPGPKPRHGPPPRVHHRPVPRHPPRRPPRTGVSSGHG